MPFFTVGNVIGNYKILSNLRSGCNVCVVEDVKTNEKFVLKSAYINDESKKGELEKLISIWKELSLTCKYIAKFKDFFYDNRDGVFVVSEYCEGGDLEMLLKKRIKEKKPFSEEEVLDFGIKTFSALKELHAHDVVFPFIPACDVLITKDSTFKLKWDLEIIKSGYGDHYAEMPYISAEVLTGENVTATSSNYSVGVLLYEMITLKNPFRNEKATVQRKHVLEGVYPPINREMPSKLVRLIYDLVSVDKNHRPSSSESLHILQEVEKNINAE